MPLPRIESILNSLNKEVLNKLELSQLIQHPGENGRAREQIIAEYLRKILPNNVKIDTGFIIDARGGISNQIDIVIYRDDYHPVFEIGKIKHFMIESVIAVIENKASILSTSLLESAFENIKSVKLLDRTNNGKNIIINTGKKVNKNYFQHQFFGAIITEKSLSSNTLKNSFINFFEKTLDMNLWLNMYADIRGSSVRYITEKMSVSVIPSQASALYISDPDGGNYTPPLLEITYELVNLIRVAPIIDYNPCDYFYGVAGQAKELVQFPERILKRRNL